MLDEPDAHLDPAVAAAYDASHADANGRAVVAQTVDRLVELADGGPAVEFAIGTGRIAVPLSERGVPVTGMDLSEPMLDQLRAKPEAERIRAVHGDMTTTHLGDDATLVYLVFNTIMNLRTQDAQIACFANAARHLRAGGRFVVETMVPELRALPPGETIKPFDVSPNHLGFDEYVDPVGLSAPRSGRRSRRATATRRSRRRPAVRTGSPGRRRRRAYAARRAGPDSPRPRR
ncbi:MAG: class I SAM-dependent methyltransferase [Actinomycetota bacterium]